MKEFLSFFTIQKNYLSIIIIFFSIITYLVCKKILKKIIINNENTNKFSKKKNTYVKFFNNILKYLVVLGAALLILQVNGVNISSIVASLGLISLIVGFALQDALKDIIMGINIFIDDYFSIGDVVKIEDVEGKVIEIGLKFTKLKDINNNNIFVISNRNISKALNISEQLDINIPLPYDEKIEAMENIIKIIIDKISTLNNVISVEYKGLNEFGDSAIFYKIRIFCKPEFKPQTKRDANRIIKFELDKNNISIPYKQIDIHNK